MYFIKKDICPIINALENKQDNFLDIDNYNISYFAINKKINQAQNFLQEQNMQKNDVFALSSNCIILNIAFIFAALREKVIVCLLPFNQSFIVKKSVLNEIKPKFVIDTKISLSRYSLKTKNTRKVDLDAPCIGVLSSGTTATPKILLHSINNFLYSAIGLNEIMTLEQEKNYLFSLPIYTIGGICLIFRVIFFKLNLFINSKIKPVDFLNTNSKIDYASLVQTQLREITKQKSKLNLLIGGSFCSKNILKKAQNLGINTYYSYGCTEMASTISCAKNQNSNAGKILKYREISFTNKNEILLKGKTLAKGVLKKGKLEHLKLTNAGFYKTADLGFMDENKNLIITGRKDNMFICGGVNMQPELLEKQIFEHLFIRTIIVGVSCKKWGQKSICFLKHSVDLKNAKAKIKDLLGNIYTPKDFFYLNADFNFLEKINRKQLLKKHLNII